MDKKAKYFKGLCLIENWKCETVKTYSVPFKTTQFEISVKDIDKKFTATVSECYKDEWIETIIKTIKLVIQGMRYNHNEKA